MNFTVELQDIKQFFEYLGYAWKGEIAAYKGDIVIPNATLITKSAPCKFKIYNSNGVKYQLAEIDAINFVLFDCAYLSDIDSVPTLVETSNYSNKWVSFLAKRYGADYTRYVTNQCKSIMHNTIQSSLNQIGELNQEKRKIVSKTRKKINELNAILALVNEDEQIKKR